MSVMSNKVYKSLVYDDGTMYDMLQKASKKYPNNIAYSFMGKKQTYQGFVNEVDKAAKSLVSLGVKEDEIVCIAMPNVPQAIIFLYAVNKIGAIANMIHPLSSQEEMLTFINRVNSKTILIMDQFYDSIKNIRKDTKLVNVVVASVSEKLPFYKILPYKLTTGKSIKKIDSNERIIRFNDFLKLGNSVKELPKIEDHTNKVSLILHSGGTTGKIKGVCLSNKSVNAATKQIKEANPKFEQGNRMLTVMPIFHGNGLIIGVHAMLCYGVECVLIPRFSPESYAKDMVKNKCNYVSGVPTLYGKMIEVKYIQNKDLSFLKGVYCGADSLSIELEDRINTFLHEHGCKVSIRQGYGMTEGVVVSTLNPDGKEKPGSIGMPLSDVDIKIVKPGTTEELPTNEVGEIVFSSITNMSGYYKDDEETNITLVKHDNGKTYVHSGDLGSIDEEGYVYFKGRIKRMIVTNGYNVFPLELESILETHEFVERACVLGIPDKERIEKVVAFIVLNSEIEKSDETKQILVQHCKNHIAKYALPRDIVFIDELPKTKVGKVDYNKIIKSY